MTSEHERSTSNPSVGETSAPAPSDQAVPETRAEDNPPPQIHEPEKESRHSPEDSMHSASRVPADQPAAGVGVGEPASKSWKEWITLLALLLGILGMVLTLPKQFEEAKQVVTDPDGVALRILEGEIRDAVTNEPLSGVEVVLPRYEKRQTTGELGRYTFELEVPRYARVTLRAAREGYRPLEVDPMVEGSDTWTMRRLE